MLSLVEVVVVEVVVVVVFFGRWCKWLEMALHLLVVFWFGGGEGFG